MKITATVFVLALGPFMAANTLAQSPAGETARNVRQQERIENGLQSGALNTREAARLEKNEAHVEHLQAAALKDGELSSQESQRIRAAQNRTSAAIYREKHDTQLGNPESASSQRMQADVQRNANQQARIHQGITSGALNYRETASLERGQARINRREARSGADGHVGAREQQALQNGEDKQSRRIWRKKHNGV